MLNALETVATTFIKGEGEHWVRYLVTHYVVHFEPGFPRADVEALGRALVGENVFAPGYIPPPASLLHLDAMVYAKDEQGWR